MRAASVPSCFTPSVSTWATLASAATLASLSLKAGSQMKTRGSASPRK